MYWKSNQQVNLRLAFPRTVAFGIIISVNILHLAPVTWLGSRCLIGIAEPYAKAELVALAEAKLINQGAAYVIVGEEAHGGCQDRWSRCP